MIFHRDASSALLQLVNQLLYSTYFTPVLTLSAMDARTKILL